MECITALRRDLEQLVLLGGVGVPDCADGVLEPQEHGREWVTLVTRVTGTQTLGDGGVVHQRGRRERLGEQALAAGDSSRDDTLDEAVAAIPIKPAAAVFSLEQEGFRFFADDGPEASATALAAQDENITRPALVATRLRTLANATGDRPAEAVRLKYRKTDSHDWRTVQ
jgi:hypothetical protein